MVKHSFYKQRLSEFIKISSIGSEFNKIEERYLDIIALADVDAEPENLKHQLVVLNDELIKEYNKVYETESKDGKSESWKQKYDPKNLRALNYQTVELKTESLPDKDRSDIKQPTQLKQLNLNEISKPLWIQISRNDFISLIKDFVNNLDDKDYQTTVDKRKYDLKNAEKYLMEIIIKKISEKEALELYNSLIKLEATALDKASSRGRNKRNKTLNILNNIESRFFEGLYLHYSDDNLTQKQKKVSQKE